MKGSFPAALASPALRRSSGAACPQASRLQRELAVLCFHKRAHGAPWFLLNGLDGVSGLLHATSSLFLHACLSPTATNHPRAPITACSCAPPCTDYHLVGCVLSAPRNRTLCVSGVVRRRRRWRTSRSRRWEQGCQVSVCMRARSPARPFTRLPRRLPACPTPSAALRLLSVGARVGQINPPAPHKAPHTPNAARFDITAPPLPWL